MRYDYSPSATVAQCPNFRRAEGAYHIQPNTYWVTLESPTNGWPHFYNAARINRPILLDWEPWVNEDPVRTHYVSDEVTDEELIDYAQDYLWLLEQLESDILAKNLTPAIYAYPLITAQHFNTSLLSAGNADYDSWVSRQANVIDIAESEGFLPKLRELGGHIMAQAYLPVAWDGVESWKITNYQNALASFANLFNSHSDVLRWRFLFREYGQTAQIENMVSYDAADWWCHPTGNPSTLLSVLNAEPVEHPHIVRVSKRVNGQRVKVSR